jgi:hypothetical protein
MSALIDDLAHNIGGDLIANDGDPHILVPGGFIYCGITGKVRLQTEGRVFDLGTTAETADSLAGKYAVVVAALSEVTC